ncbi:hypothetical protein L873DRAFT_1812888 [Choiromyces venosus 120613-1]|uniref:Uncharacterized protein n=1 Tax=Choiromyces venosus 120613-1 TaxID=1336337 RepID=A0A3N4JAZ2_9PEZI|nr:hypothetical protein L873DRAFT_1812888 [Choiromyces venosus 120613-1]
MSHANPAPASTSANLSTVEVHWVSVLDIEKYQLLLKWANKDYDVKKKSVMDLASRTLDDVNATPEELWDAISWRHVDLRRLENSRLDDCRLYETKLRDGRITDIFDQVVQLRLSQGRSVDQ